MKLSDMLRAPSPSLSPTSFAGSRALDKAMKRVEQAFPHVEPMIREKDPEAILRRLLTRIGTGNWSGFTYDDLGIATRAAFGGEVRKGGGAVLLRDMPEFTPACLFVLEQAGRTRHAGQLGVVLGVHLHTYVEGAAHTVALAGALKARRRYLSARSREVLDALPEALDAANGASNLGRRIADAPDTATFLAGLPGAPSGGLIDAAGAGFVARLAPHLSDPTIGRRVLDWFAPKGGAGRRVGAPEALDALLVPWKKTDPSETWKQILLDRLVGAYDDPRMPKSNHDLAWDRVSSKARETFIRWQTGAALDAFLDIVSETIAHEDKHMWADRRPFWEALHEQGAIRAAWVAFSPAAVRVARHRAATSGIDALRHFGRQIAGGGRGGTSILIMDVNGRIVVEGSHSYKVHVFPEGHRDPPKLFDPRYDCEEIRLSLGEQHKRTHHGEVWKRFVREETGCPLF